MECVGSWYKSDYWNKNKKEETNLRDETILALRNVTYDIMVEQFKGYEGDMHIDLVITQLLPVILDDLLEVFEDSAHGIVDMIGTESKDNVIKQFIQIQKENR